MNVSVALLRGVNVSGQKIIKMEELRKVFESLRYSHVVTYVQSGNVVFVSGVSTIDLLRRTIERRLLKVFGFEASVIVKRLPEIGEVVKRNPFKKILLKENEKIYVTFLAEEPSDAAKDNLLKVTDNIDEIRLSGTEVYALCRKGYAKTQFSNTFIEKKFGVVATTRNLATVNKLWELGNLTLKTP